MNSRLSRRGNISDKSDGYLLPFSRLCVVHVSVHYSSISSALTLVSLPTSNAAANTNSANSSASCLHVYCCALPLQERHQPDPLYLVTVRLDFHSRCINNLLYSLCRPFCIHIFCFCNKEVVVQVSPINSKEMKFVHLSALNSALGNDPDLAGLDTTELAQILQTLLVCTGCDYISFFLRNR